MRDVKYKKSRPESLSLFREADRMMRRGVVETAYGIGFAPRGEQPADLPEG